MTRAMKDSGIEWIGQIPKDWEVVKVKEYYNFEKGKNASKYKKETLINDGLYPVYSGQTENDGILGYLNHYEYYIQAILVTTVGANVMTTNILNGKYSLSQNCVLVTPKNLLTNIHYINYILKLLFRYEKSRIPNYMQPSLRIEDLNKYKIPLPPLEEQERIASILDEKMERIDAIIADTKQSIEELKQYKQSLITETVTKGLDKNVPMKDSGIEWIGQIPENWEVVKVKRIFSNQKEIVGNKENEFERLALTMNGVIKRPKDNSEGLQPEKFNTYQIVYKNELLFKLIDLENKKTSRVGFSNYTGIVSPVYIRLNNDKHVHYGHWYFMNMYYQYIFNYLGAGVRSSLNAKDLLELPYLNISLEERERIATFLDTQTQQIDQLIQDKEQLIIQYEEYKKSMIYEYVTGKRSYNEK